MVGRRVSPSIEWRRKRRRSIRSIAKSLNHPIPQSEPPMEYRLLGRTGVRVSPLCLGAMMFGLKTEPEASYAIIDRALDAGLNFIDTANVYSRGASETITGQ